MDFERMMNDTDRLQVMNRLFTSFEIYKFSNGNKMKAADSVAVYDELKRIFRVLIGNDGEKKLFCERIYCELYTTCKETKRQVVKNALRALMKDFAEAYKLSYAELTSEGETETEFFQKVEN